MKANKNTSVAREFIGEFFSDCSGAMMVKSRKNQTLEILVFYNDINSHYQKVFHYHNWEISTKIYRTSNCYALLHPEENNHKLARMFSNGTILKDYDHEVETIQSEAQIMIESNHIYSFHRRTYHHFSNVNLVPSNCA